MARSVAKAEAQAPGSAERRKQLSEILSHQGQIDLELDQDTLTQLRELS